MILDFKKKPIICTNDDRVQYAQDSNGCASEVGCRVLEHDYLTDLDTSWTPRLCPLMCDQTTFLSVEHNTKHHMGIRQSDNTGSLLILSRCFRLVCQQFVICEWMVLTYQCFTTLNRGYRALQSSSIFRVLFLNNLILLYYN